MITGPLHRKLKDQPFLREVGKTRERIDKVMVKMKIKMMVKIMVKIKIKMMVKIMVKIKMKIKIKINMKEKENKKEKMKVKDQAFGDLKVSSHEELTKDHSEIAGCWPLQLLLLSGQIELDRSF